MRILLPSSFLLSYILFSLSSPAQKNFQDGYIVRPGNDTARGRIDFRDWNKTPTSILFQDPRSGLTVEFVPAQLLAFFINGDEYATRTVHLFPYSPNIVAVTGEHFDSQPYDKTIFLRLVTRGKLTLYAYRDSLSVDYFFVSTGDGKAGQLRLVSRLVETGDREGVVFDDLYKNQLSALLSDCDKATGHISQTKYEEASLRKLVFSYNTCGKDTVEKTDSKNKGKVEIAPVIGFFSSKAEFSGFGNFNYPVYNSVVGGLGLTYYLPKNRQQFALIIDLLYHHFYSRTNPYQETTLLQETGILDYNLAMLDIQFRWQYPTGKLRPFFNAGIANSVVMGNKSEMSELDQLDNSTRQMPFPGFRTYQLGLLLGGGVKAGRVSLELRSELNQGVSSLTNARSSNTIFYLLAAFRL